MAQPKIVNAGVKALLSMPLTHRIASKDVMILRFRGRKTGRRYSLPVGYHRGRDSVLTTTDDRWWRNLHPEGQVRILIRRKWFSAAAAALPEHDQAIAGMTELVAASERYAGWLRIGKEPDGTPSRTDVEREFAGGRIPIRFTRLTPSTGKI